MTDLDRVRRGTGVRGGPPRRRGRARRWWLALVALAAAIAVVTDLSVHASPAYHRAQLRAYLSRSVGDTAQCQAGLRDAVTAYTGWVKGTPGRTRGTAATFAGQAVAVCGFANENIVTLASGEPPRVISSPAVAQVAPALATWAYLEAFTFLQDLRALIASPASATARTKVEADLSALAAQRGRVETAVENAERAGHLPPHPVRLLQVSSPLPVPPLPGGSRS